MNRFFLLQDGLNLHLPDRPNGCLSMRESRGRKMVKARRHQWPNLSTLYDSKLRFKQHTDWINACSIEVNVSCR